MAYDDWSPGFRDVFEDIPGVPLFREYELGISRELFQEGWIRDSSPEDRANARDEFFAFTGLPESLFPWQEWREAMGY